MIGSVGFTHRHLHVHGTGGLHRMAPEAKLVGLFVFVLAVALTPRRWIGAFAIDAAIVTAVAAWARLGLALVVRRLAAITPFVAFALLLPIVGDGEQTSVGGIDLSIDGLWAMWNILAKAGLGASASIIVMATTPVPDVLAGLARLRLPAVIVGIITFMFRYLDLIVDEFARMRRAMVARGHDPRWLWQARPIASSAGAMFVRTYERGERVHDAMSARGFTGMIPELSARPDTRPRDWLVALTPGLIAAGVLSLWLALA